MGSVMAALQSFHRVGVTYAMSTLIPVSGETSEIPPPRNRETIVKILGGANATANIAVDGSTWWVAVPFEVTPNERAARFFGPRSSGGGTPEFYGLVLYMSAAETAVLNGAVGDPMVPVTGKTYDVKEKLKTLGARWDPDKRVWMVPKSRLQEAEDIVRRGPNAVRKGP